ncbi:MAG: NlpC/P60 family protein [Ruminococcaceae bacterium]|nr:NlpC/P60 family protein [Oscillospiraceae bacterium]
MYIQKKFSILLVSTAIMLALFVTTVGAESFPCVGIVVADDVNVRSNASTDSTVLSRVNCGVTMDVYERIGNWFRIGIGNDECAFISADYVSVRPQDVAARGNYLGGNRVVQVAKQYLGTPYVYGGSSPSGFDCSGFTSFIYRKLGYTINRVAHDQLANGVAVNKTDLKPGDLVMFKRPGNSYVHHVGIYAGDGMMIHAPQAGDVVKFTSITTGYYNNVYYAARRIIH